VFINLQVQGVDFFLNADGPFQGRDDAAVGADVVQFQTPFTSVLEALPATIHSPDGFDKFVEPRRFLSTLRSWFII